MCRWSKRSAFLRDEKCAAAVKAATLEVYNPVVEEAISTVFEATGEEGGFMREWPTDSVAVHLFWPAPVLTANQTSISSRTPTGMARSTFPMRRLCSSLKCLPRPNRNR